jgi:predicted MFS family arabinose efflux permease
MVCVSYVPSSVKELIKKDLHLTDAQTAWPLTGMILVYMVASPIFGWVRHHTHTDIYLDM